MSRWLLLGLCLAACGDVSKGTVSLETPEPEPAPAPVPPPPSVQAIESTEPLPRDASYRLIRVPIDVSRARLRPVDLEFERPLRAELERSRASVVINGGFWDPEREPEGLTVTEGRAVVPFDTDLGGGVLVIEHGRARVLDAEAGAPIVEPSWSFAQQAKPRLVVNGQVNIERDTGRRADRTAVCLRDGGRTIELVHARTADERRGRDGPTLFRFAHTLVDAGCEDALNLDGGPSSGIAWREEGEVRDRPTRVGVRLGIAVHIDP